MDTTKKTKRQKRPTGWHDPIMSPNDYAKAKASRERQNSKYPEYSTDKDEERSETMSAVEFEAEMKPKAVKSEQNEPSPPIVGEGLKAVWHKPHSYKNHLGKKVDVVGHWEIIQVRQNSKAGDQQKKKATLDA